MSNTTDVTEAPVCPCDELTMGIISNCSECEDRVTKRAEYEAAVDRHIEAQRVEYEATSEDALLKVETTLD